MLFSGVDAGGLYGLWTTNGTAAGTQELAVSGAPTTGLGLDPSDFTVFGDEALFSGIDASGKVGLWETDGSTTRDTRSA